MRLDPPVLCVHCSRRQATELDHDPPLAMHLHRPGTGCCRLVPSCAQCNRTAGLMVANGSWRPGYMPIGDDLPPERDGLDETDKRWNVPWLKELRKVPRDAVWPRLMTIPHPRAVGSLGPEFIDFAEQRSGRPLRWWQRLVATRLLEVDEEERLLWETLVLSMARQLGKSWLLRELCFWRIHQTDRFGEPQDVMHTGKDLAVCKEVQRPARVWAKARRDTYHVREVNGQEEIELMADGSRWMLRAKEAVYGYTASLACADEAWKVKASSIEEGLTPTMTEREQAQLVLVSTAHRMATSLMLGRRQLALQGLEVGDGDLLIEWSAPGEAQLEDVAAWRLASPHWTPQRERMISKQLELAKAGELDDPDEPDPIESFRSQWLNQWPRRKAQPAGATEELLPPGVWADLAEDLEPHLAPIWVAVEDDYGLGAAVAAVARLEDGRLEVDGWLCPDWDAALADVVKLGALHRIRELHVGASLASRVQDERLPKAKSAAGTQTRAGLAVFRDLALNGMLVHDATTVELDSALSLAQVREAPSGLHLIARGPTHLVRAVVWAVAAAARPARVPVIR
jgi:hypothetical protein